jgi:hypothetical protein
MYQMIQSRQDRNDFAVAKENGISLTDYKNAKSVLSINDETSHSDLQRMAIIFKAKEIANRRARGI